MRKLTDHIKLIIAIGVFVTTVVYFNLTTLQASALLGFLFYAANLFDLERTILEGIFILVTSILLFATHFALAYWFNVSFMTLLNQDSEINFIIFFAVSLATLGICVMTHCLITGKWRNTQSSYFSMSETISGSEFIEILIVVVIILCITYAADHYIYQPCGVGFSKPTYYILDSRHSHAAELANLFFFMVAIAIYMLIGIVKWFSTHKLWLLTVTIIAQLILSALVVRYVCHSG